MTGRIHVLDRADHLDAQAIRDMLNLPAWSLFTQKVEGMLAAAARKLESCSADELPGVQAEVKVLRRILTLPETIINDVEVRGR